MADNNSTHIYTIASGNDPNSKPFFSTGIKQQNGTVTRYFSGVNAEIYFNNIYIDEANYIEFALNQSTMLIFGYNSYVYDTVAKGSRMLQGNFSVNFTSSNYMYSVLNTLQTLDNKGKMNLSSNLPLWNRGFDIYLSYGNNTNNPTRDSSEQIIKLIDVHLTGCQLKNSGKTGDPIEEIYSFIAKDIDFFSNGISYKDSMIEEEKITEEENENFVLKLKEVTLEANLSKINFELNTAVTILSAQWKFSQDTGYQDILIDTQEKMDNIGATLSPEQHIAYKKIPEYVPIYTFLLLEYQRPNNTNEELEFKYQIK